MVNIFNFYNINSTPNEALLMFLKAQTLLKQYSFLKLTWNVVYLCYMRRLCLKRYEFKWTVCDPHHLPRS